MDTIMDSRLVNLLTNPFITQHEQQEVFYNEQSKILSLIDDERNREELKNITEKNLKGLWCCILRAVFQKGLEGDVQALKLLFDYADKQRLFDVDSNISLADTSEKERKTIAEQIRQAIKNAKKRRASNKD